MSRQKPKIHLGQYESVPLANLAGLSVVTKSVDELDRAAHTIKVLDERDRCVSLLAT